MPQAPASPSFVVRYEDAELAVVSKPAGMVVHPGAGNRVGTLTDLLLKRWPLLAKIDHDRAGLVHRLDKDTSGLVLVAKTPAALKNLATQFADRIVSKRYTALVHGVPKEKSGRIEAPISRHHADRKRMAVRPDGKAAVTDYTVTKTVGGTKPMALLDVRPSTGRTHQIRVHLAALGHPIVGDRTYGSGALPDDAPRQFLHAAELRFRHPRTGRPVIVKDPLPDDLTDFLKEQHG